jgi:hypothetical protein
MHFLASGAASEKVRGASIKVDFREAFLRIPVKINMLSTPVRRIQSLGSRTFATKIFPTPYDAVKDIPDSCSIAVGGFG